MEQYNDSSTIIMTAKSLRCWGDIFGG